MQKPDVHIEDQLIFTEKNAEWSGVEKGGNVRRSRVIYFLKSWNSVGGCLFSHFFKKLCAYKKGLNIIIVHIIKIFRLQFEKFILIYTYRYIHQLKKFKFQLKKAVYLYYSKRTYFPHIKSLALSFIRHYRGIYKKYLLFKNLMYIIVQRNCAIEICVCKLRSHYKYMHNIYIIPTAIIT